MTMNDKLRESGLEEFGQMIATEGGLPPWCKDQSDGDCGFQCCDCVNSWLESEVEDK